MGTGLCVCFEDTESDFGLSQDLCVISTILITYVHVFLLLFLKERYTF